MSVVIMTAVWQSSEAKGSTRLVLLSLADQANDEGNCWPSVGSIAKRCRISERSVQMHLHALEASGEVERTERSGRSTMYRVTVGRGAKSAPVETPAESAPPQNLHPADSAPGGEAGFRGGVKNPSPRTVREPSLNPKESAQKRGTRLPDDFVPSETSRTKIREQRPDLDLRLEHENFCDYWHAKAGRDATKLDWDATWRKWMRSARGPNPGQPLPPQRSYRDRPVPERPPWEAAS